MMVASGTFCQKIQRHDSWSTYQPSREAEMFRDNSRFKAYTAMPYAQYLGGVLSRTKLNVSGTKNPDANPLANCKASSVFRLGENGVMMDIRPKHTTAWMSTRRGP